MREADKKTSNLVAVAILILVLAVPATIWAGYVLSIMWAWFVVPLGVARLGVAHAIGITATVGLFLRGVATKDFKMSERTPSGIMAAFIAAAFGVPAYWLAVGWVIKGFMS